MLYIIIKNHKTYHIKNLEITGTWNNPQTVYYDELLDISGLLVKSEYTFAPIVIPGAVNIDTTVSLTEPAGLTSFKIARSDYGDFTSRCYCDIYITKYKDDVTVNEVKGSLWIDLSLSHQSDSCSFILRDPPFQVREGMEVIIYQDSLSNKKFAGIINSVLIKPFTGFQAWEYSIQCGDYSKVLEYKKVAKAYAPNKTCAYIINDVITNYVATAWGLTQTNVHTGPIIESIAFNYLSPADCIRRLCELTGYQWYVDFDKDVHFFVNETEMAPYEIIDDSLFSFMNLQIEPDLSQIRNKVTISGGTFLSYPVVDSFIGAGTLTTYTLTYNPHNLTLTEDAISKTVGIINISDPAAVDYMMDYWQKTIERTAGVLPLNIILNATYSYSVKIVTQVEDIAAQAALAALEGGDGVREIKIIDNSITSLTEAERIANQQLIDYASPSALIRGSFSTYEDGFDVGQTVTINLNNGNYNGKYQIQTVNISCISDDMFHYDIAFSLRKINIQDILVKLLKKIDTPETIEEGLDVIKSIEETIEFSEIHNVSMRNIVTNPYVWGPHADQFEWGYFQWQ